MGFRHFVYSADRKLTGLVPLVLEMGGANQLPVLSIMLLVRVAEDLQAIAESNVGVEDERGVGAGKFVRIEDDDVLLNIIAERLIDVAVPAETAAVGTDDGKDKEQAVSRFL
jgi:hypothetical protein